MSLIIESLRNPVSICGSTGIGITVNNQAGLNSDEITNLADLAELLELREVLDRLNSLDTNLSPNSLRAVRRGMGASSEQIIVDRFFTALQQVCGNRQCSTLSGVDQAAAIARLNLLLDEAGHPRSIELSQGALERLAVLERLQPGSRSPERTREAINALIVELGRQLSIPQNQMTEQRVDELIVAHCEAGVAVPVVVSPPPPVEPATEAEPILADSGENQPPAEPSDDVPIQHRYVVPSNMSLIYQAHCAHGSRRGRLACIGLVSRWAEIVRDFANEQVNNEEHLYFWSNYNSVEDFFRRMPTPHELETHYPTLRQRFEDVVGRFFEMNAPSRHKGEEGYDSFEQIYEALRTGTIPLDPAFVSEGQEEAPPQPQDNAFRRPHFNFREWREWILEGPDNLGVRVQTSLGRLEFNQEIESYLVPDSEDLDCSEPVPERRFYHGGCSAVARLLLPSQLALNGFDPNLISARDHFFPQLRIFGNFASIDNPAGHTFADGLLDLFVNASVDVRIYYYSASLYGVGDNDEYETTRFDGFDREWAYSLPYEQFINESDASSYSLDVNFGGALRWWRNRGSRLYVDLARIQIGVRDSDFRFSGWYLPNGRRFTAQFGSGVGGYRGHENNYLLLEFPIVYEPQIVNPETFYIYEDAALYEPDLGDRNSHQAHVFQIGLPHLLLQREDNDSLRLNFDVFFGAVNQPQLGENGFSEGGGMFGARLDISYHRNFHLDGRRDLMQPFLHINGGTEAFHLSRQGRTYAFFLRARAGIPWVDGEVSVSYQNGLRDNYIFYPEIGQWNFSLKLNGLSGIISLGLNFDQFRSHGEFSEDPYVSFIGGLDLVNIWQMLNLATRD